jgi:CheY-like chemotaxis protein
MAYGWVRNESEPRGGEATVTGAANNPLKGLRILVVDDQAYIRTMVQQVLRKLGCESVIQANDGLDALTQLKATTTVSHAEAADSGILDDVRGLATKVDCVITDINMAPMNGLEFLKAIRSGSTALARDVPVIILTGHSDEMFISTAIALDANGFATKPTSAQALAEKIQRSLSRKRTVKPEAAYMALIIPDLDVQNAFTDTQGNDRRGEDIVRAADIPKLLGTGSKTVALNDLKVGDALAASLSTVNGILVVPAGSKVTEALIAALHDLSHIVALEATVQIRG